MLGRLLERLARCQTVNTVCLATSVDPTDAPLDAFARAEGVACHRGSLDDVLDRVANAARSVRADLIVEITGDCPLVDPDIIDAAVRRYARGDADYVINVLDRLTFPIGFDVQVYSRALLEEVAREASAAYDRANVTPFIYHHPERYRLLNLRAPPALDRPRYRLCVDYPDDFEVVAAIFQALYPDKPAFTAFDIVRFLDAHPDIAARNIQHDEAFIFPSSGGLARQEILELIEP
jgi:spore coat polysaccharide biosynthesis protein SpsF